MAWSRVLVVATVGLSACQSTEPRVIPVPETQGVQSLRYELGHWAAKLGLPESCAFVWGIDGTPASSCRAARIEWPNAVMHPPLSGWFCSQDDVFALRRRRSLQSLESIIYEKGVVQMKGREGMIPLPEARSRQSMGALLGIGRVGPSESVADILRSVNQATGRLGFIAWPLICLPNLDKESYQRAFDSRPL